MAYTLTIDRGNTSSKVVVWDGERAVEVLPPIGDGTVRDVRNFTDDELVSLARRYNVKQAAASSVAEAVDSMREAFTWAGIDLTVIDASTPMPMRIDYATPMTLGSDRIAAALGAMSLYPGRDVLIVDIGTAATYDRLTADGHYLGGNIAPGVGMRLRALHAFTRRLPEVKSIGDTPLTGYSTETAMRSGAVYGVVGEICFYRSTMPDNAAVVLTGGWSADIAKLLPFETRIEPLLVNRGLNKLLDFSR